MKILLVADLYPPLIGGTERHVQNLAWELRQRGHDITVATMWLPGTQQFEIDHHGVRVYRIATGWTNKLTRAYTTQRPHHPPFADPGVAAALRSITAGENPDVVYAHNWMLYSYLAGASSTATRPVVACLHDYWPICPARNLCSGGDSCRHDTQRETLRCAMHHYGMAKGSILGLALWNARRRWHHRVERYLAVSEFVATACRPALGGRPVYEAPTFVSSQLAAATQNVRRPDFAPPGPYVLYVGGLGKHKGVHVLAEAYRLLGTTAPPLLVLGTPVPEDPIAWPGNVSVHHNVSHHDVMAAWKHASAGVIPSIWPEPFGQVAVEAMVTGTPLVATNVGGLGNLVAKHPAAVLVPPNSPEELAAGIRQVLAEPAMLERARVKAPLVAEQFTTTQGVTIVEDHLMDVVATYRSTHA